MNISSILARGTVALALAGLIGAACADGTTSKITKIKLVGKNHSIETLSFEGELPVGQSRGLYTDAGTAVTVLRTESGLNIQTPERTIDVPYGNHDALIGAGGESEHRVIVHKHGDDTVVTGDGEHKQVKRVFVLRNGADAADAPDLSELQALGELDELGELGELDDLNTGDEDGKQIVIVRTVRESGDGDASAE